MYPRYSRQYLVENLLNAYRAGAFPMADPDSGELALYVAERRGVFSLEPDAFHIPRRLNQKLKADPFLITADSHFEEVVRHCAQPRGDDDGAWINELLINQYLLLHEAGHAHSVEATFTDPDSGAKTLAGGIFGIHIGGAFFGESMFHAPPPIGTDASKVCLVHLVAHLRRRGFMLFDTQLTNPFLDQFGCIEISQSAYDQRLAGALKASTPWGPFDPQWRDAL